MTSFIILVALALVIAIIVLKHALQAILLVGLVLGGFFVACHLLDADWRVVLSQGVETAHKVLERVSA